MRHIGIFSGNGVRFDLIAVIILIPAAVNLYLTSGSVLVREAVKVNEHTVFVSRYIGTILIHKVKYDITFFIEGIEIIPVANNNLQFLPFM